ncbi:hypothetical protein BJ944DRAFT_258752 [Cunninghamella echinulata]|nr:hypothetical protein BJ944DRAFT_258752 [Cunninghamella echinulata]
MNKNWTTEDERIVQYQWASRTFTSTCLKLTMQNETVPAEIDKQQEHMNKRNKTKKIQIYTFLENWYLHSMFNKSQKVLLGFSDIKPCVILSMDNFMFTPPPLLPSQSGLYQSEMELIDMESKEEEIDDDEEDIFNTTSSIIMSAIKHDNQENNIFMDENTWMTADNSSILGTIDENEADDDDDDDDALVHYDSDQPLKTSDLISWYQSKGNVSLHNYPASTTLFDNHKDKTQTNIQNHQTGGSSWIQKIQYSFIFISKRLIETAYVVSELVESFTNKKNPNELIATTGCQQLEHHHSNINNYYNCHSITGKCILFIFRIWRIFFLGIEIAINQLATTTTSIDNHSMLPKLLITSNTA